MRTSYKVATAVLATACIISVSLPVAQAVWVSPSMPDCRMSPVVGRDDKVLAYATSQGGVYPASISGRVSGLGSNDEREVEDRLGPNLTYSTPGLPILQTYDRYHILSTTIFHGISVNVPEAMARLAGATFNNVLKVECRLQVMMYNMGFAPDQRINDLAIHDRNLRNHSIYQRTNDLEDQIEGLRRDVQALSLQLRVANGGTSGSSPYINPPTPSPSPSPTPSPYTMFDNVIIPPPTPPAPAPSKTVTPDAACVSACSSQRISCIKQASTSKAMQACEAAQTTCLTTCQ